MRLIVPTASSAFSQVFDAAVEAAKLGSGAGPRHLATDGGWSWLLRQLAADYGVRISYAGLAGVRWIVARPDRLTPTADCLDLLVAELGPLHRAQTTMMPQVCFSCINSITCQFVLLHSYHAAHDPCRGSAAKPCSACAGGFYARLRTDSDAASALRSVEWAGTEGRHCLFRFAGGRHAVTHATHG